MLCFNFSRSAPAFTILSGLRPSSATLSRPALPYICRSVTGKQYRSYIPLQNIPLQSNHFQCQSVTRRGIYRWSSTSQLLPSRLAPLRSLPSFSNSAFTQSSIRISVQEPVFRRSHATTYDPETLFLQPLDPSHRRHSIRRGFTISLPILAIYLLVYVLSLKQPESKCFWSYRRRDGFLNVTSLCTFITSQFTHDRLIPLVIDSLALVLIASILGSVLNCRTFCTVYVIGGFFAAVADCAWAQATNPCRSLTVAQIRQNNISCRLINEAIVKVTFASQLFSKKGLIELWTNRRNFVEKYKEITKHADFVSEHYTSSIRDYCKWLGKNQAAWGSLVCLSMALTPRAFTLFSFFLKRPDYSDANVEQSSERCNIDKTTDHHQLVGRQIKVSVMDAHCVPFYRQPLQGTSQCCFVSDQS